MIALFVGGVFIFLMIFIFGLNSFGLGNPPESTKISTIKNNTETTTNIKYYYEQNYSENYHDGICDSILITAKKHYAKGDYLKAKECYQSVVDKCGPDYKAAAIWVNNCIEKETSKKQVLDPIRWNLELMSNDKNLDLIFRATIDDGWHLYGHELPKDGPIETNINFNHVEGVELVGKFEPISKGVTQFDENYGLNLTLYETEAIFVQTIKVIDENWSIAGSVSFMGYSAESVLMGTPFTFSIGTK